MNDVTHIEKEIKVSEDLIRQIGEKPDTFGLSDIDKGPFIRKIEGEISRKKGEIEALLAKKRRAA